MIILVGAQKGGCGKTTTAVNLAAEFKRREADVCLVDADSMGSASDWAKERLDSPYAHIPHVAFDGNVSKNLRDLALNYEVVIVDVAGHDSKELRTAMMTADIMVSPFQPSQLDLNTLSKMAELIEKGLEVNEDLKCLAVISRALTNHKSKEIQEARACLVMYPEFITCKTVIYERKAHRDAIAEGAGVIEWADKKAASEIKELAEEIINHAKS